jgi:hypothetical protein
MCETSRQNLPQAVTRVLEDVQDWHQLQLGMPRCDLQMKVQPALSGVSGAPLHHALLAMLTLAKQEGCAKVEMAASMAGDRVAIEVSAAPATNPDSGPMSARRQAVIAHLIQCLGGELRTSNAGAPRSWRILLPAVRASARPGEITSCSTAP